VLAFLAQWGFMLGGSNRENGNPLVGIVTVILAAVGAGLIKAAISRSREYVADAEAARICQTPEGLIGALQKLEIAAGRIPLHNPNPAMNNLFIVEPLTGGETLMNLFATHPPTERRIAALASLR
jgi:heat shock protein HtpX